MSQFQQRATIAKTRRRSRKSATVDRTAGRVSEFERRSMPRTQTLSIRFFRIGSSSKVQAEPVSGRATGASERMQDLGRMRLQHIIRTSGAVAALGFVLALPASAPATTGFPRPTTYRTTPERACHYEWGNGELPAWAVWPSAAEDRGPWSAGPHCGRAVEPCHSSQLDADGPSRCVQGRVPSPVGWPLSGPSEDEGMAPDNHPSPDSRAVEGLSPHYLRFVFRATGRGARVRIRRQGREEPCGSCAHPALNRWAAG
jgi:hypothetical protein